MTPARIPALPRRCGPPLAALLAMVFLQVTTAPRAQDAAAAPPAGAGAAATRLLADPMAGAADRLEARQLYRSFLDNEDYPQALEAASYALELAEAELPAGDPRLAPALNDLGEALLLNDLPEEARRSFARSAEIIEAAEGIFSPRLFAPMLGIGRAEQALGRHEGAVDYFHRAQHVTHRSEGVYSLTQVPAISELVESLMALGQWTEAENVQLSIYKIYRGRFGNGSLESLPALYELARYYHDTMQYRQARMIYRDAIELIEAREGPESVRLVTPLRGLASTWSEERTTEFRKGLEAHERIVSIVEAHPELDSRSRILAYLELGDWYVQFNREEEAWAQYQKAWSLAQAQEPDEAEVWARYFDRPHLIHPGATLSLDFMGYGRAGDEVFYDFEFEIATSGRPEDIEVLGTNLHGQTRSAALHAFRYARFRPRIVDGVPVATPGYKVRRVYPTTAPGDYGFVGAGPTSGIMGNR